MESGGGSSSQIASRMRMDRPGPRSEIKRRTRPEPNPAAFEAVGEEERAPDPRHTGSRFGARIDFDVAGDDEVPRLKRQRVAEVVVVDVRSGVERDEAQAAEA